jgi:hypothetical protein
MMVPLSGDALSGRQTPARSSSSKASWANPHRGTGQQSGASRLMAFRLCSYGASSDASSSQLKSASTGWSTRRSSGVLTRRPGSPSFASSSKISSSSMIAARGQTEVIELSRAAIASEAALLEELRSAWGRRDTPDLLVTVVDQYEENVAQQTAVPSQFVERLSLLDRGSRPQEGRTTRSPERGAHSIRPAAGGPRRHARPRSCRPLSRSRS